MATELSRIVWGLFSGPEITYYSTAQLLTATLSSTSSTLFEMAADASWSSTLPGHCLGEHWGTWAKNSGKRANNLTVQTRVPQLQFFC